MASSSFLLSNSSQQIFYRRVVPKRLAEMRKPVHISRPKHKTPPQLERIPPQLVLLMPLGLRLRARSEIVSPQQMKNVRRLQFQCVVRLFPFVNQKRKRNSRLLPERLGILRIAQTYRCQRRSLRSKFRFLRAQLRDVLPAENSTVVPQKHHHRRLRRPN